VRVGEFVLVFVWRPRPRFASRESNTLATLEHELEHGHGHAGRRPL